MRPWSEAGRPHGRTADVRERFYAIWLEAKPKHVAVVAVCEGARKSLSVS